MWFRTINITTLLCLSLLTGCQNIKISEQSFLFPDKPITQETLDEKGLNQTVMNLTLKATDGVELGGIAVLQPNAKFTTLYFGGNQTRIKQLGNPILEHLIGFDNNLVAFDHRGYGLSHGKPSIANLKSDAQTVFDFIKTQPELKDLPVIVHGLSLGSMIAADLAVNRNIDGLILEGSTTSVNDMFDENIPWFIQPFLTIDIDESLKSIDNAKILTSYEKPLLILVGEKDYQTPVNLSEKLYHSSASSQKQLLIVKGKGHGNATFSEQFKAAFTKFSGLVVMSEE